MIQLLDDIIEVRAIGPGPINNAMKVAACIGLNLRCVVRIVPEFVNIRINRSRRDTSKPVVVTGVSLLAIRTKLCIEAST